jgi:DNA-binding XRE family transcriptional regulator
MAPRHPPFDGERFRAERQAAGYTASEFAVLVGRTRQTLRNYEVGRSRPSPATVERIGQVLGIDGRKPNGRSETPSVPAGRRGCRGGASARSSVSPGRPSGAASPASTERERQGWSGGALTSRTRIGTLLWSSSVRSSIE